jgi:hypothetical protein
MAGAGAGFQWMSLKQKEIIGTERNLEGIVKEVDDHHLR